MRQIANEPDMPDKATICRWLAADKLSFRDDYAYAREAQAEIMHDEILEIADDGSNDWMERELKSGKINIVSNTEHISRSRLRVEARKWLMGRMKPKKYGDRTILAGDSKAPLEVNNNLTRLSDADLENIIKNGRPS